MSAAVTEKTAQPALAANEPLKLLVVLLLAVVLSALAVAYAKFQSRSLFVELQGLKRAQDAMDEEWGQLQLEQSTWATHGRVESTARTRLEMVLPEAGQVVVVRP